MNILPSVLGQMWTVNMNTCIKKIFFYGNEMKRLPLINTLQVDGSFLCPLCY